MYESIYYLNRKERVTFLLISVNKIGGCRDITYSTVRNMDDDRNNEEDSRSFKTSNSLGIAIRKACKHNTEDALEILQEGMNDLKLEVKKCPKKFISLREAILKKELDDWLYDKMRILRGQLPKEDPLKSDKKQYNDLKKKEQSIVSLCNRGDEKHIEEAEKELDTLLSNLSNNYSGLTKIDLLNVCKRCLLKVAGAKKDLEIYNFKRDYNIRL